MRLVLLVFVYIMVLSNICCADPGIKSISGIIDHESVIIINGEYFGRKEFPAPKLWDAVENMNAYHELSDGDIIPVGDGYPWTYNGGKCFNGPVRYSVNRSQHGKSVAQYSTHPDAMGGTLGVFGVDGPNLYISWWWRPSVDWEIDTQSNKILRADDGTDWPSEEEFSWRKLQFYIYEPSTSAYVMNNWVNWDTHYGVVGQWNRQEIYFDNEHRICSVYTNARLWGNYSYTESQYPILRISQIGLNPNGDIPDLVIDFDDIYVDNTCARVEIGDSSMWDNCTHREIQIPVEWSDTQVKIRFNQGGFQEGDQVYLFVVDADGNVSEGYPITIGQSYGQAEDVNQDGSVNISDVYLVVNVILGNATSSRADVNGDGTTDVSDVQAVVNAIVGR